MRQSAINSRVSSVVRSPKLRGQVADAGPGHPARREQKGRERALDHGDGAVLEVSRGEALGDHVAGLHQLEAELEGVG